MSMLPHTRGCHSATETNRQQPQPQRGASAAHRSHRMREVTVRQEPVQCGTALGKKAKDK